MPVTNDVGWSENTELKQKHFAGICKMLMTMSKNRGSKPYHYFDLNAGHGHNPEPLGGIGSPLIFLQTAAAVRIPYRAFFFELSLKNCDCLSANCEPFRQSGNEISIYPGDHKEELPLTVCQIGSVIERGLLYVDPNAMNDLPFETLAEVSRDPKMKYVDFIMQLPATTIKRVRGAYEQKGYRSLKQYLRDINKAHWIIREPYGRQQWTFAIGTNWVNMAAWTKQGFYPITSERGREILDLLSETKEELNARVPVLF